MSAEARNNAAIDFLKVDLCIVGSGPAGMTLARELAPTRLRILIIESGGPSSSDSASELNRGSVDSPQGYPGEVLEEGRRRQLGGSANLWNHEPRGQKEKFIRCVPLDAIDFEKRDWLPLSGWPFSYAEMVPYYQRAQRAFGIGKFDYTSAGWRGFPMQGQPIATESMCSSVSQFTLPRHFLKDAVDLISKFENARFLLKAHLQELERDFATNRIVAVRVVDDTGKNLRVEAGTFVLAAGGLENPRILLLNQKAQSGGLGNQYDQVGRCFMDHPSITLGTFFPKSANFYEEAAFYDQHIVEGQPVMGKLQLRPEVMRREKLLNLYSVLVPRFRNLHSNLPEIGRELLAKLPQYLMRRRSASPSCNSPMQRHDPAISIRQRLLEGYFSECFCGWSKLDNKSRRFGEFGVRALVELAPDPSNRVVLSEERDRLGQPKMKIIWRWNDRDLDSIRRTQQIYAAELARTGHGVFVPLDEGAADFPRAFYSTHHFMGTTRMHADPRQGVVDAQGKVHGLKNLYIAGSSVFPTGGCANPTLTLVALAIRLADHLAKQTNGRVAQWESTACFSGIVPAKPRHVLSEVGAYFL